MPWLPQRLSTSTPFPAIPGLIREVASSHLSKVWHGWLALFPVLPVSHPSTQVSANLPVPLCVISLTILRVLPSAQLFAIDIFIDLSKTNWAQGPLAFGHTDSWLDQSIRTSLQQEARGLTVDSPLNTLSSHITMLGTKLLQKSLEEYSIFKLQQGCRYFFQDLFFWG